MAQKYLNDFEKFESWQGDEFLEETIDIYLARKGVAPKMMAGGSLNDETPMAYIQILGYDEGKWFDLTNYADGQDVIDAIYDYMTSLNEEFGGNREEFEVTDYEGFGDDLYDEYMGANEFGEIIEAYEKYENSDFPADVISSYKKESGKGDDSLSDVIDEMENNYFGKYDSLKDFGYEMVEQGVYEPSDDDVYITDTDKRILAGEESDSLVDEMTFDELMNVAPDTKSEYEDEKSELEDKIVELQNEIKDLTILQSSADDNDEYQLIGEQIEETEIELDDVESDLMGIDSRYEDKAREEARESFYDDIYDRLENDLSSWLEDYGYTSELENISFLSVDYEKIGDELSSDYLIVEYDGEMYFFNNYAKGGRIVASKRKPKYAYYIVESSTKKLVSGYSTKAEANEQRKLLIQQYPSMRFEIYPLANLEAKTDLDVYAKKDYVELSTLDKIKKVSVDAYRYGQEKVGQANQFLERNDVKGKIKRGARKVADKTKQGANWLRNKWLEADFGDGKGRAKLFADGGVVGQEIVFDDSGETNTGVIRQITDAGDYIVATDDDRTVLAQRELDVISLGKMRKKVKEVEEEKGFFSFFKNGGKVLATSSSKEGINKLIEQYLYGSTITLVETDNDKIYEVHNKKGKTLFYVEIIRGRYKFIEPTSFADGGMAGLGEISGMLPNPLPMSTITPMAKGGSVEDNLLKELRKLQRDLNSSRLSTYMEGDNSEQEMARRRERESKLARFNEVLRLLREIDSKKYADGGNIQYIPVQQMPQQMPQQPVNSPMGNMDINSALEFVKQNPQILSMLEDGGDVEENLKKKDNSTTEIKSKKSFFGSFAKGGKAHARHEASETAEEEKAEHQYDVYDNKRMLKNQAIEVEHHSEELNNQVELTKKVPAWVIAKMERATTDLSDITHYLDGENKMANGGKVGEVKYEILPHTNKFIVAKVTYKQQEDYTYPSKEFIYGMNGQVMKFDDMKSAQNFINNIEPKYPYGIPKANVGMILLASEFLKNKPQQPQQVYYIPQPQPSIEEQSQNTGIVQNIPTMESGGSLGYDDESLNNFCIENVIGLANDIQSVKYYVTDRFKETDFESKNYKGRLIIVFKESASVNVVNAITKFIERAEDCHHLFEQSVNVSGSEPNSLSINLLSDKYSDTEFNKGGKVYDYAPKKINLSKTKKITTHLGDYNLGLITKDFVYFVNSEEGDDNANVMMYNKKGELLSDNYFANSDLFETLQMQNSFEFIHPDIEAYRQEILKGN
jgi:hypothetical protein